MAIPKTMKATILFEQRKPLFIDEVELPQSLDVGQVFVETHHSGICGSQLSEIYGAEGEDRFLPHLLGHEASATVIEAGPGVRHVKPSDCPNLFRANRIKLRELLTEHMSLHDIDITMKNIRSGKTSGRCLIKM